MLEPCWAYVGAIFALGRFLGAALDVPPLKQVRFVCFCSFLCIFSGFCAFPRVFGCFRALGAILDARGALLGVLGALLDALGALLGPLGALLDALGALLGRS